MIVFWSGKGYWVSYLILAALFGFMALIAVQAYLGIPVVNYLFAFGRGLPIGGALAGVVGVPCLVMGLRNNRSAPVPMFEPESGRTVLRRARHTFWFIEMQYWGGAFIVAGVLAVVYL